MTALTHIAVAAVAATRTRNLGLAIAVSAASHFALDAVYHFEALDQLGIPGRWTPHQALITVAAVSAVPVLAAMMWLWSRNRDVGLLAFYGLAFCFIDFIKARKSGLIWPGPKPSNRENPGIYNSNNLYHKEIYSFLRCLIKQERSR